jgi:hypothetical protein
MVRKVEIDGAEVEVYTADDVKATVEAAVGEVKKQSQAEIDRINGILEQRTAEFTKAQKGFQKLTDEQVGKLSDAERVIYQNQLAMQEKDQLLSEADEKTYKASVDAAIRARVGKNDALFEKVKGMYDLVQLEDVTPEQMNGRVAAALGAVSAQQPDLLAAAGFSTGSFEPPKGGNDAEKNTFADSDRGKQGADELGLKINYTEEEKKRLGMA